MSLLGNIHVVCHTKAQKLCARHCVTKQCLGMYLSFVIDVSKHLAARGHGTAQIESETDMATT